MKNSLRITAAQINTTVGDIQGNTEKIIAGILYARDKQKADAIVFPEMALTGYPPEDLLFREELYKKTEGALKLIKAQTKDIYVVLGLPTKEREKYFNTALVIHNKKITAKYHKQLLPNQGVFDEKRYFTAGNEACVVNIKGIKTAITICEDIWSKKPAKQAKKKGAWLLISLNASPFEMQKSRLRELVLQSRTKENKIPAIYVNTIGGQDELVFDGGSFVTNAKGEITQRGPFFSEDLTPIDFKITGKKLSPKTHKLTANKNSVAHVYKALVLGVRDYVEKNGFAGAVIGVSGGIDSALTLAIAVDALGSDKVRTVYLPSRYSSKTSTRITEQQAKLLGVKYSAISIEPIFKSFLKSLPKEFGKNPNSPAVQNLQARARGTMLMAFSNKESSIVLSTGNKSEMAVGYATLYGDMAGGFCVLKDIPKTLVFELAKYRNKASMAIPKAAITRPPSAELAKNQKDSDDLPPYPVLDKILEMYIELHESPEKIIAAGFKKEIVERIIGLVNRNEYKRRQAPPGVKVTSCAFGRERRYPITSKFK